MAITRRDLVRGFGAGVLGAGALTGCGPGRRGGGPTSPPPSAPKLTEPDTPLVIGQIGAAYGRMAVFEEAIAVSIEEAQIDVNARWGGLFGHEVVLLDRYVMQEPGEDLAPVIEDLAGEGATCLITSIDEESLIAAMPAVVEAGLAVIDVFTSGMDVRAEEVQTSNLLMRLAPDDRILAVQYGDIALGADSDKGGAQGTVAFVSEDTSQGRSLRQELELYLNPLGGRIVSEQFYAVGDIGDIGARVKQVLKEPPALLVLNGGQESASFLSALHEATADEDGRRTIEIPAQLSPAATVDYSQLPIAEELAPECLTSAAGFQPGGEITGEHEAMMLNRSSGFLRTGYAYSQQGYDAFTMACLAAQHALSVTGTALAAAVPSILTGAESCTDYEACRRVMRTALEAQGRATVAYVGRSGKLELGPRSDARIGEMRRYGWSAENVLEEGTATSFEAAG
ncbi:amino acid ABC transporter substrate-binding protein [Brachybacterium avium]|uniref:Amino acid ABC transporter substrate-binding protein n=1 Tax=Brachybacterium avium TaxID=2017485 RepID=A0A220UGA1_9MICO|nr:ABC transporter substrate-binding protein [Brachybacterium avium]ASK66971.1 amino acid ABC transporter substrate-binding protein [Brachybacterium avium]